MGSQWEGLGSQGAPRSPETAPAPALRLPLPGGGPSVAASACRSHGAGSSLPRVRDHSSLSRGPAAARVGQPLVDIPSPPPLLRVDSDPPSSASPSPVRHYLDAFDADRKNGRVIMVAPSVEALEALFPFTWDAFQRRAVAALQRSSNSCVVAAPTSAGKTLIAEAAAIAALAAGARVIYTTPLKARRGGVAKSERVGRKGRSVH